MEDRYSSAFDEVRASDTFKQRMVERMQELNEAEPQERARRAVSIPRRVKKRTLTVLVAAAILLIGGTALAIGINAMIGARNRAQTAIASYQAVLEGQGVPTAANPEPSPYITYAQFNSDEEGKWLPNALPDLDLTAQAGGLTVRLENLEYGAEKKRLVGYLWIEGAKPAPYALDQLRLSINGGEPIMTEADIRRQAYNGNRPLPTATPFEDWAFDTMDENWISFPMEGNPLRAGNTFTLTGKLNGEAFTLTYDFTEARYEELRQTQLQEVGAIGAVIDAIPDETIPVNVTGCGYLIEEIALSDHFIYYVDTLDPAWPAGKDHPSPPYDTYDKGLWVAVDGMLYEDEFVSASDDENGVNHGIYRAYFPYDESNLPATSLLSMSRVIFRVEWATGKVTGPKDEAEYEAWRKESMELSSPDYGTDYMAKVSAKADTFTVSEVIYFNSWAGYLGLVMETDQPVDKPLYGMDRQPVVTLNGVKLNNHTNYIQTPNDFMGGSDRDGKRVGFWLDAPALRLLPDTFDVTVSWNDSSVTFTLHKADFTPGDAQHGEYHKLFGF